MKGGYEDYEKDDMSKQFRDMKKQRIEELVNEFVEKLMKEEKIDKHISKIVDDLIDLKNV